MGEPVGRLFLGRLENCIYRFWDLSCKINAYISPALSSFFFFWHLLPRGKKESSRSNFEI